MLLLLSAGSGLGPRRAGTPARRVPILASAEVGRVPRAASARPARGPWPRVTQVNDRYGSDVLRGDWRRPTRGRSVTHPATPGLVVEDGETGWVGAIVAVETIGGQQLVSLE
ncbi:MAG: DUF3097 family protein, partial [Nostocoides sp.]